MKKVLLSIVFLLPLLVFCQIEAINGQLLRKAVPDSRVDSVYLGINLPQAFTGEDVLIGVTDWGFDYTHPVFYDVNMQQYRILRAWDQYRNAGPAPAGFDYGTELIGQEQLLGVHCDTSNVYKYGYHGTHVASIAAGAGAGTEYRGVAPGAQLLLCSFLVDEQAAIDAFHWMYNVAQQEQKRLVINMSWGLFYMDYMDGAGPIADAIQELSDLGVVFVVSAGNEGDENFHIMQDFSETTDTLKSVINYSYMSDVSNTYGQSITMTNSPGTSFTFCFTVMNNSNEILAYSPFYNTADGDASLDSFIVVNGTYFRYKVDIEQNVSYNNRPNARLRVKRVSNSNYKYALMVKADEGVFHAWNVIELNNGVGNWGGDFSSIGAGWTAGDDSYGLSAPGNAPAAISVAAHQARPKSGEEFYGSGSIATFSSHGPVIDGSVKPDLSAPGVSVTAALSSYTTESIQGTNPVTFGGRTYKFCSLSGTSMAAPMTTGAAALVLQANPYLSSAQVKEILMQTTFQDTYTAQAAEYTAGTGKLNAYQAVLLALNTVGVEDHSVSESRFNVYPNPVSDQAYVVVETDEMQVAARLFDLSGKMVGAFMLNKGVNTLSMQQYAPGFYILHLNDGKTIQTKQIVKQ